MIRTLSLDIVAGALAIAFFFSSLFEITLPFLYWIALGFTVWLIYMVDHFADSYLPGSYSNKKELHQLRAYRKLLGKLSLLSIIILIIITFLLPLKIILFGIAGVFLMIVYTIMNQVQNYSIKRLFPREFTVALFYTFGTAGIPFLYLENISSTHIMSIGGIFLIALTNTLIYSFTDYNFDSISGVKSMAVVYSPGLSRLMGLLSGLLGAAIFIYLTQLPGNYLHGIIGISMSVPLFLILLFIKFFAKRDLWVLADLVLLLPFVILFL